MKYLIWACAFTAYLLMFVGIFTLMGHLTRGIKVEAEVEREVLGEIIVRTQEVEFNDLPVVRWTFGMSGLFIAVGGGFLVATLLNKSWLSEDDIKSTKTEKIIRTVTFIVVFFICSFALRVHTVLDLFMLNLFQWGSFEDFDSYRGLLFLITTCVGANFAAAAFLKFFENKKENKYANENGGMTA